jgi:hypothetical protein
MPKSSTDVPENEDPADETIRRMIRGLVRQSPVATTLTYGIMVLLARRLCVKHNDSQRESSNA